MINAITASARTPTINHTQRARMWERIWLPSPARNDSIPLQLQNNEAMLRYISIILWTALSVPIAAALWGWVFSSTYMTIGFFLGASKADTASFMAWIAASTLVIATLFAAILGKLPGTRRKS
jgi:hypothetical protein